MHVESQPDGVSASQQGKAVTFLPVRVGGQGRSKRRCAYPTWGGREIKPGKAGGVCTHIDVGNPHVVRQVFPSIRSLVKGPVACDAETELVHRGRGKDMSFSESRLLRTVLRRSSQQVQNRTAADAGPHRPVSKSCRNQLIAL